MEISQAVSKHQVYLTQWRRIWRHRCGGLYKAGVGLPNHELEHLELTLVFHLWKFSFFNVPLLLVK